MSLSQSDHSVVIRRGWREEGLANQMSASGGDRNTGRNGCGRCEIHLNYIDNDIYIYLWKYYLKRVLQRKNTPFWSQPYHLIEYIDIISFLHLSVEKCHRKQNQPTWSYSKSSGVTLVLDMDHIIRWHSYCILFSKRSLKECIYYKRFPLFHYVNIL